MKKIFSDLVIGFFAAVMVGIVYVQAGKGGGVSGGKQTANVVYAGGSAVSGVAKSLEAG